MAATEVSETYEREGSQNHLWQRTYRRTFLVVTNDSGDGPLTVREALPVSIGNSYASRNDVDRGAYCQSITVNPDANDGKQWKAVAEYGPYDASVQPQNPTERPPQVSWGFAQFEKVVDVDEKGNPTVNSAGDPFDPPITRDDSRPVLTIRRAEAKFDAQLAAKFKDAVNADAWFGYAPGLAKVMDVSAELAKDPDIGWFWWVTYQFQFNDEGWHRKPLDQGYRKLVSGVAKQIKVEGVPVTSPKLLDGTGAQLPDNATADQVVYLDFQVYPEIPFAGLNIDLSMIPSNTPA